MCFTVESYDLVTPSVSSLFHSPCPSAVIRRIPLVVVHSVYRHLNEVKAHRDDAQVKADLEAITECVRTKKGNLLDLAVKAAGHRATLGEISDACEAVVGRYKAEIKTISGVYSY